MIQFSDVSYRYPDGFGVEGITFEIKQGEILSLVGPNGAGKSTILKLAAGHLSPSRGNVTLFDRNLSRLSARRIAKEIAYLSQQGLRTDLSVEDVVLHGRFPHTVFPHLYGKKDRLLAQNAMKQMNLSDLATRSLSSLSGGERQKAMIAMALCQNCPAILMDEPTAFLDACASIRLMEELRSFSAKGKGILCVVHDLPLALRFSHRIAVINHGRIVSLETPEQTAKSGVLTDVFGIELAYSDDGFYYYGNIKK